MLKDPIEWYAYVSKFLYSHTIDVILYGSTGVSVYLSNFREIDDIDLLVEDKWVQKRWNELKSIMLEHGFSVTNEKEHEFENKEKVQIAFASHAILSRDHVADLHKDVATLEIHGTKVRTLTLQAFLKAYEFSSRDGYRKMQRGEKDAKIVKLLKSYLAQKAGESTNEGKRKEHTVIK